MALILSLETATTACSVALAENGIILSLREINEGYAHAENITVFIEEVLKEAGLEMHQLDAIAVSSGPGSYTGLRIGVSTAKGLCYALDKPLISVGTLESMARGFRDRDKTGTAILVPMIDARRMEVYCAVYDGALQVLENVSAKIIDENSFAEYLAQGRVIFFGDGAKKCEAVLMHPAAVFTDGFFPSAQYLVAPAFAKYDKEEFEDLALFEPFYLKDFIPGIPKQKI